MKKGLKGADRQNKKSQKSTRNSIASPEFLIIKNLKTPIGEMTAGATEKGICVLEFSDRIDLEKELNELKKQLGCLLKQGTNEHLKELTLQLKEYFSGKRNSFKLKLDFVGTPFQKTVWRSLLKIPFAKTISYKEQAESINQSKSIRAMAHTNGMNKISIVVPCHRVIGSNGSLTGYGGGLWRKKYLINMERKYNGMPPLYPDQGVLF